MWIFRNWLLVAIAILAVGVLLAYLAAQEEDHRLIEGEARWL